MASPSQSASNESIKIKLEPEVIIEEEETEPCGCLPLQQDENIDDAFRMIPTTSTLEKPLKQPINPKLQNLLTKVESQNQSVNELKKRYYVRIQKCPRTKCEDMELEMFKKELDGEIEVLKDLTNQILELQSAEGVKLENIRLATTFSEENMNIPPSPLPCPPDTSANHLEKELECRDQIIESLQKKINSMKCEIINMVKDPTFPAGPNCSINQDQLEKKLNMFAIDFECLRNKVCNPDDPSLDQKQSEGCAGRLARDLKDLKIQYDILMREFELKNSECESLKFSTSGYTEPPPKLIEFNHLRKKCTQLIEEQEQFKLIIKEQADHLDEYQNKFLKAQQKVEEQKCHLENMAVNNKNIEKQINVEIQRIKNKFQDKLRELFPLPKLLENEQLKLCCSNKAKDELEKKLKNANQDLTIVREKYDKLKKFAEDNQFESMYNSLRETNKKLNNRLETVTHEKEDFEQQLVDINNELIVLRRETALIILKTKERMEVNKQLMQNQINKLEIELCQSRAMCAMAMASEGRE